MGMWNKLRAVLPTVKWSEGLCIGFQSCKTCLPTCKSRLLMLCVCVCAVFRAKCHFTCAECSVHIGLCLWRCPFGYPAVPSCILLRGQKKLRSMDRGSENIRVGSQLKESLYILYIYICALYYLYLHVYIHVCIYKYFHFVILDPHNQPTIPKPSWQ